MYVCIQDEYNHLLDNAVTAAGKRATARIEDITNKQSIKYAKLADIFDRTETNSASTCFITFKDRKEIFVNHPITKLINPVKNEIGGVINSILDNINICLCKKLKRNEWKNTTDVINWLKKID